MKERSGIVFLVPFRLVCLAFLPSQEGTRSPQHSHAYPIAIVLFSIRAVWEEEVVLPFFFFCGAG